MRKLIIALFAAVSAALPAHAQIDEKNPEMQFRALSALAGGGHRCAVARLGISIEVRAIFFHFAVRDFVLCVHDLSIGAEHCAEFA